MQLAGSLQAQSLVFLLIALNSRYKHYCHVLAAAGAHFCLHRLSPFSDCLIEHGAKHQEKSAEQPIAESGHAYYYAAKAQQPAQKNAVYKSLCKAQRRAAVQVDVGIILNSEAQIKKLFNK